MNLVIKIRSLCHLPYKWVGSTHHCPNAIIVENLNWIENSINLWSWEESNDYWPWSLLHHIHIHCMQHWGQPFDVAVSSSSLWLIYRNKVQRGFPASHRVVPIERVQRLPCKKPALCHMYKVNTAASFSHIKSEFIIYAFMQLTVIKHDLPLSTSL